MQGESSVMDASAGKVTYLEVDNAEVHSAAECSFMSTLQRFTVSLILDEKELGMRRGTFALVRQNLLTGKRCHTASTNFSASCLTCL